MDKKRIDAIQELADRLADYVISQDDYRMLFAIHRDRTYANLSWRLTRANLMSLKAERPPIVTFENFVEVFEEEGELPRLDWSLVRNLILIRMVERIYSAPEKRAVLAQQAAEIVEDQDEETSEE